MMNSFQNSEVKIGSLRPKTTSSNNKSRRKNLVRDAKKLRTTRNTSRNMKQWRRRRRSRYKKLLRPRKRCKNGGTCLA